jgi:hypothetical protein
MPPLPPVALVLKVEFKGHWAGKPWANIMHAKFSGGPPSAADCATLATAFGTSYHSVFMAEMAASTVTLDSTKVTDLSTTASASAEQATAFAGSAFGDSVTNNVAFGVDWAAATRYRGGHAKTFFPGHQRSDLADSVSWTAAAVATMQGHVNAWLSGIVGLSAGTTVVGGLVVVHYRRHNIALTPPQVEDITAGAAKANIYSMRGRRS